MSEFIKQEKGPDIIQTFDELAVFASLEFGLGEEVCFQPYGRYDEERQVGKIGRASCRERVCNGV